MAKWAAGLNCEHVLTRSVRDSAAFLDATAGAEMGAPYRVQRPVHSYLEALERPSAPLRIACIAQRIDGASAAPEIGGEARCARRACSRNRGMKSYPPGSRPPWQWPRPARGGRCCGSSTLR
jgi:Asp-tRNA(Asn)/Glu-tRNA(Gln) amidotransferase A subunit family amidase